MTRNTYDLSGNVAVVTGGAQGLGLAIAELFLKSGASVAVWDRDQDRAQEAVKNLAPLGQIVAIHCDVADWPSVQNALAATLAEFARVDILVNCAGIAGTNASVLDYDVDEFQRIIDINLVGTFHTNKAVVAGMKSNGYGRIVNIASIAGKEGNPNASAYSASKSGVIGFTKSLGKEMAGFDVAINCITPAAAKTAIFDQMSDEHIAYMLSKIPRNRFLQLDEVSAMVAWLVSSENSFTTGAVFDLSGGRATY